MRTLEESTNFLLNVSDEKLLELVELLTHGVLELNARILKKIEIMYSVGHYPAMLFRLTTELIDPADGERLSQVSGFRFALDQDIDDDVYIEPLSSDGFWEEYLQKTGITHIFSSNEVGIKSLYRFINDKLKLWDNTVKVKVDEMVEDVWRDLKTR